MKLPAVSTLSTTKPDDSREAKATGKQTEVSSKVESTQLSSTTTDEESTGKKPARRPNPHRYSNRRSSWKFNIDWEAGSSFEPGSSFASMSEISLYQYLDDDLNGPEEEERKYEPYEDESFKTAQVTSRRKSQRRSIHDTFLDESERTSFCNSAGSDFLSEDMQDYLDSLPDLSKHRCNTEDSNSQKIMKTKTSYDETELDAAESKPAEYALDCFS